MAARDIEVLDKTPASRKLSREDAVRVATDAKAIHVARGKKVAVHDGGKGVSDETLDAMLGSTGNLRSPLVVVGDTVVVGFNESVFEEVFA